MPTDSRMTRRGFAAALGTGAMTAAPAAPRPNILWITCEDTGPHLHACGDPYSVTPNLDKLAARGLIYRNAWSNAPVCAPARTTIISGLYPPSTGSEHMRSMTGLAPGMKMYPQYLREAGYYCTNNSKEDYNLAKPGEVWDESSPRAHYNKRAAGQPFFAIFNLQITHESQIRRRPHTLVHDPAKVRVPAYHPDTPEVRHDWAQYYDNITTMDGQAGKLLQELESAGLAGDTIVFFYGDHGSGMPRSKRWPYNSGLNVSIVASIPKKFAHLAPPEYKEGGNTDRLVGFVDLAPTLLSLAGMRPPDYYQGYAFMGRYHQPAREYNFGFRGRMDERYDCVRSVRDKRYVYIRNYMPHKIYGQHISYMFQTPTTQVWKRLYDEGKLNAAQRTFWETKAPEELYDLQSDPDEVRNLAADPKHKATIERLRGAQRELALKIRDVGLLPEDEIHSRAQGGAPYAMGHDPKRYPVEKVVQAAEAASSLKPDAPLAKYLADSDSAVRYWGAMGLLMRGAAAVKANEKLLLTKLEDSAPAVRIAAAEALGRYGSEAAMRKALGTVIALAPADKNGAFVSMEALNAMDAMGKKAAPLKAEIEALPREDPKADKRVSREYINNLIRHIQATLA